MSKPVYMPTHATVMNNFAKTWNLEVPVPTKLEILKNGVVIYRSESEGVGPEHSDNHPKRDDAPVELGSYVLGTDVGRLILPDGEYTLRVTNLITQYSYNVVGMLQGQNIGTTPLLVAKPGETKQANFIIDNSNAWFKINIWQAWLRPDGSLTIDPRDVRVTEAMVRTVPEIRLTPPTFPYVDPVVTTDPVVTKPVVTTDPVVTTPVVTTPEPATEPTTGLPVVTGLPLKIDLSYASIKKYYDENEWVLQIVKIFAIIILVRVVFKMLLSGS